MPNSVQISLPSTCIYRKKERKMPRKFNRPSIYNSIATYRERAVA